MHWLYHAFCFRGASRGYFAASAAVDDFLPSVRVGNPVYFKPAFPPNVDDLDRPIDTSIDEIIILIKFNPVSGCCIDERNTMKLSTRSFSMLYLCRIGRASIMLYLCRIGSASCCSTRACRSGRESVRPCVDTDTLAQ